jgi:photosystem II stability/assembly factor-like uncharacterized protein
MRPVNGTRSSKNTVDPQKTTRKLVLFAVILISCCCRAAGQCGREAWGVVEYKYFSGYWDHPLRTDAQVLSIKRANDGTGFTIYAKLNGQNSPQYVVTSDGGKSWELRKGDISTNLGFASNLSIEAAANGRVQYRLNDGLELFLRSDDGGKTWRLPKYRIEDERISEYNSALDSLYHLQVALNAVNPTQPLTLYATFKFVPWFGPSDKLPIRNLNFVYVSKDGGENWTKFSDRLTSESNRLGAGTPIGIDPWHGSTMLGVGKEGLIKSSDAGKSWKVVKQSSELFSRPSYYSEKHGAPMMLGAPGSLELNQFVFAGGNPSQVYMVTNKGLFKSTDDGESWRLLDLGFDEIDAVNSIAVDPINVTHLYVGTRHGIFQSSDGGCHFRKTFPITVPK